MIEFYKKKLVFRVTKLIDGGLIFLALKYYVKRQKKCPKTKVDDNKMSTLLQGIYAYVYMNFVNKFIFIYSEFVSSYT